MVSKLILTGVELVDSLIFKTLQIQYLSSLPPNDFL